jgi:hypothetical protein
MCVTSNQYSYTGSNMVKRKIYSDQFMARYTWLKQLYVMKFVSDLRQVGGFLQVLQFPSPISWPPRYNWNIVESGIK